MAKSLSGINTRTLTSTPQTEKDHVKQTKNKAGGVTKVGINWRKWYEATGTDRVDLSTPELVEGLEFSV